MTENLISFWFDVLSTWATVTVHILQIQKKVSFWVVHASSCASMGWVWRLQIKINAYDLILAQLKVHVFTPDRKTGLNTTTTDISKKYTSIKVHVRPGSNVEFHMCRT